MKCPKCGYLGFEHVERCRNCGYDFSLSPPVTLPELPLRRAVTPNPLDDLLLLDAIVPADTGPRMSDVGPDLDAMFSAPPPPPPPPLSRSSRDDLPLFGTPIPDDEPLIRKASPPRPPLAVRRATPEVPRLRAETPQPRTQPLVLPIESPAADSVASSSVDESAEDATVGARLTAVGIDLLLLAAIDAVVVYFTLQICGITIQDLGIVPKGPLLAFLFVQNGGYLVAFTAGGQTLGKMATGIRVVPVEDGLPLDLGRAFIRTAMWVVLASPAGLGFVTALFNAEHRGLHDRFAGTRVVR